MYTVQYQRTSWLLERVELRAVQVERIIQYTYLQIVYWSVFLRDEICVFKDYSVLDGTN